MKILSLIVPCYNESAAIKYLYKALCDVSIELRNYKMEFIFVNDGSKDDTLKKIKEFAEYDDRVIYLSFSRNFGKEAAMYAGFCER